jgi:class 3 adenylate cyclase/tetratricopeptide (TPR) repeat protein
MLAPEASGSSRDPPERRFLTIVFVDLVGYTELSERLDPEDLERLQRQYQELALTTMERFGGFVARFIGDGVLVYFGYPRAHERDAERAALAALEFLRKLGQLSTQIRADSAPVLSARIGIHSGLVVMAQEMMSAGRSVPGIVGEAANLAARLQTEAAPGEILISGQTLELIEGLIECAAIGPRPIKGLSQEVSIYRVVGATPAFRRTSANIQRGATRMVGRESSIEKVLDRWQSAVRGSLCQTVAVVAEAGVGKTRLVLELCAGVELAEATILQASCHEIFASTPLYAFGNFFWARTGMTAEAGTAESVHRIGGFLEELSLNTAENQGIVLGLLGLGGPAQPTGVTPQGSRRKRHEFVVEVFKRIARGRQTVLWVEDTHWLDPSSAELLQEIVSALKGEAVLVLLTMRSFPPGPVLPEADEVVRLGQMGDPECLEIARLIPGAEVLTPEILDQAVTAADGVPLFVEQLVMALLDERVHGSTRRRSVGGLPLMLAEMLSERLDRLPGGRRIVQAAACIGRAFVPDFLLEVLQEEETEVAKPLEALVTAEILLPRRYGAEIRYEFRHALLQRMAYESMVQTERRAMHGRIVDVLRQRARAMLPEVMAHHLTEAGRNADAIEAWLKAGVSAAARSAHVEAVDHLRRGIKLLGKIDDPARSRALELDLQVAMMGSVLATQSATSPEVHACCERGLALCAEGAHTPLEFPFAFGEFTFVNCRGRSGEAERLARMFLSLAERNGFESGRVIGHRMLGMALMTQAQARPAREQIERSLALYVPERDAATTSVFGQNTEVHSKSLLSFTLFCLGEVDAALTVGVDALRTADTLRHPHSTAIPLVYVGGWVFGLSNATDAVRAESRRLIQLAEQHRLAGFRAHGMAFFGWALCQHGDLAQGIAAIEQAVAAFDGITFHLALAGHYANLADAQRRLARMREADASSKRALELVHSGSSWLEPEVRRVAALVAADLQPNNLDRAEEALRGAVACAQELGFPVMEWRCLNSLAKFLGTLRRDPVVDARLATLAAEVGHLDRRVASALLARPFGGERRPTA